jgi:hypothetical protein
LIILDVGKKEDKGWLIMDGSKIKAGSGKHVEIELLSRTGNNEKMAFDIVPEQSADYARGYLRRCTAGKALAGHSEKPGVSDG